jgi:hypothetical protein
MRPGGGFPRGGGFAPAYRRGGGWWPNYYSYGPDVIVVQPPARDCQFTIKMPSGEQVIVTGPCPVAITGPVVATITPL